MATSRTQPPQGNLKDRIAALQQRNVTPEPSSAPSSFKSDKAPVSPLRGSLRDKIAKFERKGGVPVPRGSFGMGAPPPEENSSTKSRELYGNRVAPLGKGRPAAGPQQARAVTTPGESPIRRHGASPSMSVLEGSDLHQALEGASETMQPLSPDVTGVSVAQTTLSRRGSVVYPRRRLSVVEMVGQFAELEAPSTPSRSARPSPSPEPDSAPDGNSSTVETTASANSPSPPESAPIDSKSAETSATPPVIPSIQPQEPLPARTTAAQRAEKRRSLALAKEEAAARNPVIATPTAPSASPLAPSPMAVSPLTTSPSASANASVEALKEPISLDTSDAQTATGVRTVISPTDSRPTPISRAASGSPPDTSASPPPHFEEPKLSPAVTTGRKSFTAVVHGKSSDSQPIEAAADTGTASRSSTITSRPSSSHAKTSMDGTSSHTVLRSKRQFKHLSNAAMEPPASPGAADLAALLLEASWLEQRLADGNTTFEAPSASDEAGSETDVETERVPTPVMQQPPRSFPILETPPRPKSVARKPSLMQSVSFTSTAAPKLMPPEKLLTSTSTPTLQVHAPAATPEELPPTPPTKSARTRRYFSLRSALRGSAGAYPRHSMSSEMSSDDSAPVATPPSPSPTFDMGGSLRGDSISVRSGWSSRSGKSESAPGSLRLSPRRSVARAASFAERLLNRSSKTRSMVEDLDDTIPELPPSIPSPISERKRSILSLSTSSSATDSPNNTISFDRDIFDAFPSVPQDMPSRPPSYLFPVTPQSPSAGARNGVTRSSSLATSEIKSSHLDTSDLELGWLRQGSDEADAWLRLQSGKDL